MLGELTRYFLRMSMNCLMIGMNCMHVHHFVCIF